MAVVDELIRVEDNGSISFGNYLEKKKKKMPEFKVNSDVYYVKTFSEITRLEKNGKLLLEAVPGAAVHNFVSTDKKSEFSVEGKGDIQITMELEPNSEYRVVVDDFIMGTVKSGLSGKVAFSVDAGANAKTVRLEKM